ncbi:MAG: hypothetical protein KAH23_04380 [Kiritimatiellae bacterium]|nr:hypothetical protein [Kiritimatiellia bacterium]
MKLYRFLSTFLIVFAVGCEWESSDDSDSWTDELDWANFSGTYQLSGATPSGSDSESSGTKVIKTGESGGPFSANTTQLSGRLDSYASAGEITPGSITMIFKNASGTTVGTFTDSGGTLNGTFSVADPANPNYTGTGTIEYSTGSWSLGLQSPGFVVNVTLTVDYTYTVGSGTVVDDTGDNGDLLDSLHITQTGNKLYGTGSDGNTYTGTMWKGTTPGGDDTGNTSGQVTTGFELDNDNDITITGTFTGTWTASGEDAESTSGNLTDKMIEATWSKGDNTMEINGVTSGN